MSARAQALAPYAEFTRIGFVNILAFRLRYYAGIFTYLINVTVYYFIWTAVYRAAGQRDIGQVATATHRRLRPGADSHLRRGRMDHSFALLEHD